MPSATAGRRGRVRLRLRLFAVALVLATPATGLALWLTSPDPFTLALLESLPVLLTAIAAGAGAAWLALELYLLRGLRLLATAFERAGTGDLTARAEMHGTDGELAELTASFNRMAERLALRDAELQRARSAAEAASRAKSEFLATMSHELRTPLNAVIGFSELMCNETMGPLGSRAYRDYAVDIHESGKHLLQLINDILDFSKIEAGQLSLHEELIDPAQLLRGSIKMVAPNAARGNLTITQSIDPTIMGFRADPTRIRQIVLNLLSNAVKYTPDGGTITIRVGREADGHLSIVIGDTGIGIADADRGRIFEPFAQVDNMLNRRTTGTGLGLPLTKRLVEMHGGTLTLESVPGAGTTATVLLPAQRVMSQPAPGGPAGGPVSPEILQSIRSAGAMSG